MAEKSSSSSSGGIGFLGLLTLVFITLRLTNYIDWSWWWVLSSLWIPLGLLIAFLIVGGVIYLVSRFINRIRELL